MARHRTTFVYLAIVLGLICYLTFVDRKIPGTKAQEDSENQIFNFDRDDVVGLEVDNVHGVFVFQKKGDHWEIKSPVDTLADTATVEEVINQIAYSQPQRVIPIDPNDKGSAAALKEWGLAPAAERASIRTKTKSYELFVGRKMAINDSVYARASSRANAPVRIIPHQIKLALEKDLSDFRSRNVFDFDTAKVVKVASRVYDPATNSAQECEVDKKDQKWELEKPLMARAAEADVQALLNKILGLRAVDFVSDSATNLTSYGLTSPTATLSVTVQPQEELSLQIGTAVPGKPDQVYAQRLTSSSVFTLTKASLDEVLRGLPNVRDRHVLPFDASQATGLTYTLMKKAGEVRREKGLWNTVGADVGPADVGKVTDLLARLSQLETTPALKDTAPDLKPFGLDRPQGKITVLTPLADAPIVLSIGKQENGLLYVQNSLEPFIYTVPVQAFDFLPPNNLALLDQRAIDLPLSTVTGMTIVAPPAPAVQLKRSAGGTWSAGNVKDRMVDSVKAETQASLFCQLLSKQWLGPALPEYGLNKPVLTVAVETTQGVTTLKIGAKLADGSRAAEVTKNPIVFAISDGDYGMLNASTLQPIPAVANPAPAGPATTNKAPAKTP